MTYFSYVSKCFDDSEKTKKNKKTKKFVKKSLELMTTDV